LPHGRDQSFSVDTLLHDVEEGLKVGINKILLFGVGPKQKTEVLSYSDKSIIPGAVSVLKKTFGDDLYVSRMFVCVHTPLTAIVDIGS